MNKFAFFELFQICTAPIVIPSQWAHWRTPGWPLLPLRGNSPSGNLKENQQLQEIATSAAPPRNDNWLGDWFDKLEFITVQA